MKLVIGLSLFVASTSFAQNMVNADIKDPYKDMPDGSSVYVGKCKTHEDRKDLYRVVKKIQTTIDRYDSQWTNKIRRAIDKVGTEAFMIMAKSFWSSIPEFIENADDLTIERITLNGIPEMDLIRFNVGYGGGNGGYIVLEKTSSGYRKMSVTNDGNLDYCDKRVWQGSKK